MIVTFGDMKQKNKKITDTKNKPLTQNICLNDFLNHLHRSTFSQTFQEVWVMVKYGKMF